MSSPRFISKDTIDLIVNRADLLDTVQSFHPELKKTGSSFKGKCPNCGSEKFSITPSKGIIKCFACHQGAAGAIGYLQKIRGMDFIEACEWLAARYNIVIEREETYVHPDHKPGGSRDYSGSPTAFRDEQLRSSGIPEEAQQWSYLDGDSSITVNRYSSGSINHKGEPVAGYDMLLHYIDLDGKLIMYRHHASKKDVPYIRIRHANPNLHTDKEGKPIRYLSPTGAGNHLWIPEYVRRAYVEKTRLPLIAFIEGEKKADAMCLAGIPCCGIAGIHNFSISNEMPVEIERLIRSCDVQSVIFFLDSDFDDLGSTIPTPADQRVRTFYKAVVKFKKYFEAYRHEQGLNISTYWAHGKDRTHKGMDDLLISLRAHDTYPLPDLAEDLSKAMHSHGDSGEHIKAFDITLMHEYQLEQIWYLHSVKAFKEHYADRLKEAPEFKLSGIKYYYNKETNTFDIADKLMPGEKYWRERHNSKTNQTEVDFFYTGMNEFLGRRGYGQLEISDGRYRLIHHDSNVITAIDPQKITRYVLDFTKSIDEPEVLELLLRGGRLYLGPDRLSSMPYLAPEFITPRRDRQILCFKDQYWEITPQEIKSYKYNSLPGAVWRDDIIDFSPTILPGFITLQVPKAEGDPVVIETAFEDSDIVQYFKATSDILWRTYSDRSQESQSKRISTLMSSMADKLIATGYILSTYMDPAMLKAVICMDAVESESGRSEGGTGKSIWATMFEHVVPTKTISAKAPRLTEDAHMYEGVDERTRVVVFDDCRRNLDFESFLSDITRGITVNPKGLTRYFIGPRRMIFTTNHSIRGEDRSYVRRQYIIAFSDYFNMEKTPYDEFKHALFVEWDHKQWNYFYNLMAYCLQLYMMHGLVSFAPSADIHRRKLRDAISESVLDFLEGYFYHGSEFINRRHDIMECIKHYVIENPSQRMYATKKYMREKLQKYCEYAGFEFNPATHGKRIRNGSKNQEFFVIADSHYSAGAERLDMGVTFGSEPVTTN